jgi:hypothetical protein
MYGRINLLEDQLLLAHDPRVSGPFQKPSPVWCPGVSCKKNGVSLQLLLPA